MIKHLLIAFSFFFSSLAFPFSLPIDYGNDKLHSYNFFSIYEKSTVYIKTHFGDNKNICLISGRYIGEVNISKCNKDESNQWVIKTLSDNYFLIVNKETKECLSKPLDRFNNNLLLSNQCNFSDNNQKWLITGFSSNSFLNVGYNNEFNNINTFKIKNLGHGSYLEILGKTEIILLIDFTNDFYHKLINTYTGKCLSYSPGYFISSNAYVDTCANVKDQEFIIYTDQEQSNYAILGRVSNAYYIYSPSSGFELSQCLSIQEQFFRGARLTEESCHYIKDTNRFKFVSYSVYDYSYSIASEAGNICIRANKQDDVFTSLCSEYMNSDWNIITNVMLYKF